jgi:hypothetical protein
VGGIKTSIVDENGNPQIVYHGTEAVFENFDNKFLGQNTDTDPNRQAIAKLGHWFNTEKSAIIDHYGNAKPFYLEIQNPKEISLNDLFNMDESEINSLKKYLKSNGYDGLKIYDTEFGGYSYVPFLNNQIKSIPNPSLPPEGIMQYYKIKFADGKWEYERAKTTLELIRRRGFYTREHAQTRIIMLEGDQAAIAKDWFTE